MQGGALEQLLHLPMPAWITIALNDLNDARVAELIEAFRTEELAAGQTDPMPRIIATVAAELRDCIAFGGRTLSATADSIPAGLKDLAVGKIVRALKTRLLQAFTDDERTAEALYQKRLENLRDGNWPVDAPEDPIDQPPIAKQTGYYGSDDPVNICG